MTPGAARDGDAGGGDLLAHARLGAHRYGMPLVALLLATLFVVSWIDGFPDTVEAVGTPLLALGFAAGAASAWRRGRPSRFAERALVVAGLVVLVAAAFDSALAERWNVGYPYIVGYLPLAYTGAFLLLGPRWGAVASVATYVGTGAATLVAVGTGEIHLARGIPVLGASPILIGLLYALSWSLTTAARATVEARRDATTDPLTGAWNRRSGEDALGRAHGRYALLMVDLDDFKRVNDERGHAAGDAVLRRTADAIRAALRPDDRVVRWGGDEFLVLAPGVGPDDAQALAHRVAAALAAAAGADGVHASLGVAVRDEHEPWRATFERADADLYAAKRAARRAEADR